MEITSAHNDTFRMLASLTTAKGLRQEKLFLLGGERLVAEFLRAPHLRVAYQILGPGMQPLPLPDQADPAKLVTLPTALFDEIDVLGTHAPILALEQPEIGTLDAAALQTHVPQGIEIVIPVGDPGNLGALLRSCEAFGVKRVILTQEAAHPFLPKSVKASAGSVLRLPMLRGPALRDFPPSCIALDSDGMPLSTFKWPSSGLLVVGEEGAGLGDGKRFTTRLSIPTSGVESLNAVVAASIALAHKSGAI
ncbi:MAG: RNA methyltransferase [Negativicutes bacterium]|nr:RNA methyltransferase [Negativicutes bacterium]